MSVYDHSTDSLTSEPYGQPGMAYWHGSLNHMKLGKGKGFLISLMGEMAPDGTRIQDTLGLSDDYGTQVSFV
jgi:hypothetical protein